MKLSDRKAIIGITCVIFLALAILTFSNWATTPNINNPYFSYGNSGNRDDLIQVIDDQRVEVPIVFDIGQGFSEVSLEFSGEHDQISGLSITDKTVELINGKAISKVIIQFDSNPVLKAGTHFLTVVARDKETGGQLRTGKIRFTYNMHEVISKCSC